MMLRQASNKSMKARLKVVGLVLLLAMLPAGASSAAKTAESLLREGRIDEALQQLRQRLQESKDDAEAYHLQSRAYYALGKHDPAIQAAEKAVSLDPGNSMYHLWLGRAYGMKAERVNAFSAASLAGKVKEQFEKAVELSSSNLDARSDLAEFYTEAPGIMGGSKDKARDLAKWVEATDAARAHFIRARVAEKDKDHATAEKEYKAALAASGNDPGRWLDLASFYRRRARMAEMEAAIQSAVNAERKPGNVFFDAAKLLVRSGRSLPQAAQFFARYLKSRDKSEEAPAFEAHYQLGRLLEKQGDLAGARREYESALALAKDYSPARNALSKLGK